MTVKTTLPGMHFYTANFFDKELKGKNGVVYGPRHAFCMETQFFPDAVNHPNFPSVILHPDQVYDHKTVFSFSSTEE